MISNTHALENNVNIFVHLADPANGEEDEDEDKT